MEPRLSFITLGVADLPRARAFYRDVVGWPLSAKSQDGVAFFQLNGFVLALFPAEALARDAGLPESAVGGHSRISLAYNVCERDEVDALLAELAGRGATIVRPAADAFWGGRTGYFSDPDGYLWEVAWNPGGYLDAAGNFHFENRRAR
ncbi:VOC family protein [Chitinimonas koreensis]|uniref:VOC family protein n=1 Tax=Chitinimonas koreensis TaxID=356302 RepID=UPI00041B5E22|nr:VOC family protein [Chitinimonas koreensis]QNM96038.1 VOC family protein [Chitinimonas koreensis]